MWLTRGVRGPDTVSNNRYWITDLVKEVEDASDRSSFHVFAENMHSDVRGQIYKLSAGETLPLWTSQWPSHLFIVLVIRGELDAFLDEGIVGLKELNQLVVLPGSNCELHATADASIEIISMLSQEPKTQAADAL